MFDGNIFFPETGMPIRKSARIRVVFAVALPDPFTVLKVIQKSFTIFIFEVSNAENLRFEFLFK